MFGWGYVNDFCISLFQKEQEEKATRIYYGECLRSISINTAKFVGGSFVEKKLSDILNPKKEDERTAEEIIESIRKKING